MFLLSRFTSAIAVLFAALSSVSTFAQTRPSIDESVLYERGTKLIDAGEFEKARLSLQTLINSYPATPLRQQAREAIRTSWIRQGVVDPDPMLLYQEGQSRAAAGKTETALLAFQTLINLYPTNEYAQKAKEAVSTLTLNRREN
jgi:outer membrane protein assembly factor BamD (BamD/ComL family)